MFNMVDIITKEGKKFVRKTSRVKGDTLLVSVKSFSYPIRIEIDEKLYGKLTGEEKFVSLECEGEKIQIPIQSVYRNANKIIYYVEAL